MLTVAPAGRGRVLERSRRRRRRHICRVIGAGPCPGAGGGFRKMQLFKVLSQIEGFQLHCVPGPRLRAVPLNPLRTLRVQSRLGGPGPFRVPARQGSHGWMRSSLVRHGERRAVTQARAGIIVIWITVTRITVTRITVTRSSGSDPAHDDAE